MKYVRDFFRELETRVRNMGVESDGIIFCCVGEVVTSRRRRSEQELPVTRYNAIYMEVYAEENKELIRRFNKDSITALIVIVNCTQRSVG